MSKTKKDEILEDIREYEQFIRQNESKLKTLSEDLAEEMENLDEAEAVGKARDDLKMKQEALAAALKRNSKVADLMEEIAQIKDVIKGTKLSLSNHLVAYSLLTQERQVQMDEEGHARDVILTAKLGKEEKQYQESLFNQELREAS